MTTDRLRIYDVMENGDGPEIIEQRSMDTIDSEAGDHGYDADQWEVVRRMIHATADFFLVETTKFTEDAIASGIAALKRGCGIYADSNMIKAATSEFRLKSVNPDYDKLRDVHCHISDADVAAEAKANKLPRSLYAVRKARPMLDGGIACFGNAPVALLELNRMIVEEGIRPALVIGMPVGFVHVTESKDELKRLGIPHIIVDGRRGGSPLAVSALHALCTVAERTK